MRSLVLIHTVLFLSTLSNTVLATDYQKILNESKNIIEIEEKLPDFSNVVFNDSSLLEDQKYNFLRQYSYRIDGEYSEAFSCDCFDYINQIYLTEKKKIHNKDFLYFLLKEAVTCDCTSDLTRYGSYELKECVIIWEKLKEQINIADENINKEIEDIITKLKKTTG